MCIVAKVMLVMKVTKNLVDSLGRSCLTGRELVLESSSITNSDREQLLPQYPTCHPVDVLAPPN